MPKKRQSPNIPSDQGYKSLFSHPEMVRDLLVGYVDKEAIKNFDMDTLERCNGSYVSEELKERRGDVVWRVNVAGSWTYIYLLIEFQSSVDRFIALRLMGYMALLWQDLIKQKQINEDGTLPPLLPIVLYNGDKPWTAPIKISRLIAKSPKEVKAFQPEATYLLLDENHLPTEDGLALRNLVSALFALEQGTHEDHIRIIRLLKRWLKNRPEIQRSFGTFVANVILPNLSIPSGIDPATISLEEVESMIATRLRREIEGKCSLAEAKGKAEGEAVGIIETLRSLVHSGVLSVDAAKAQVKAMAKGKQISQAAAKEALTRLG